MSDSPANLARALIVSAALLATAASGHAQEAPAPLVPPDDLFDLAPDAPSAPEIAPAAPDDRTGPRNISIGTLEEVDPEAIGVLGPDQGGFGPATWSGSDRAKIMRMIPRLPAAGRSAVMHDLTRRLMLTTAAPPTGAGEAGGLLSLRLATLVRLGAFAGFAELLAAIPESAITPDMREREVDMLLLRGNTARACEVVRGEVRESDKPYWQRALIFCQLAEDQTGGAALSLSLLRDQGVELDPGFLGLASVLLGEAAPEDLIVTADPINLRLLLTTDMAIPDAWLDDTDPGIWRAIAETSDVPLDTRLAAAERAAAAGALAPQALGQLYSQVSFLDEELRDAVVVAQKNGGPLGRALLHRAAREQQTVEQRARVLVETLRAARDGAGVGPTARANAVAVLSLTPTPKLSWFADDAVRALLAADHYEAARAWLDVLAEAAELDAEADQALALVMPVAAIADPDVAGEWRPGMAQKWWRALGDDTPVEQRAAWAGRLFLLLDSLGLDVGDDGWALLLDGPLTSATEVPAIGIRYSLRAAARARRTGETVLFALLTLGETGPADASPLAVASAIRTLRAVGLERDARTLALEAALESGS